jgi:hypothetical protein
MIRHLYFLNWRKSIMSVLLNHFVVLLMVFISGFAVMSVEMLGGRILAPYFGSSVYVWGSLIFVFMVGLSFGYGLGGRFSTRFYGVKVLAWLLVAAALQVVLVNQMADAVQALCWPAPCFICYPRRPWA